MQAVGLGLPGSFEKEGVDFARRNADDQPVNGRVVKGESRKAVRCTARDDEVATLIKLVAPKTSGSEGFLLQVLAEVVLEATG